MCRSNAFAYNSNGVFFSTNALFPEKIGTTGSIPRNFLQRYILAASNLTDAYNRGMCCGCVLLCCSCVFFVVGAHAKPNLPAPPCSCGRLAAIEVTLASGFSINLGSVRDKRLFNIELANGAHEYEAVA